MSILKNKALQKLFSTGEIGGLSISIDRTPKIIATTKIGKKFVLEKSGSNKNEEWVLQQLKNILTMASITESFGYIVVDRNTNMTEHRTLNLALHEYGREDYEGLLEAPRIKAYVDSLAFQAKSESSLKTAEELAGINKQNLTLRLIFNFDRSIAYQTEDFDRMVKGKYVDIYLNSNTGQYKAIKNDACKALYPPLASLKPSEIDDDSLMELMFANAPELKQ